MKRSWFYEAAGLRRQSFHGWQCTSPAQADRLSQAKVLEIAHLVRSEYLPGASARELYGFICRRLPEHHRCLKGWGKHRFETLCINNGFRVVARRVIPRTTQRGDYVFDNLIEGLQLNDVDQVWVSDISYIFSSVGKHIGYSTSLLDLYSRRLLGLSFSMTMHAAVTARPVLEQALKVRQKKRFEALIFHSDGGKQYIEKHFLEALRAHNIQSSMAENCYENPHAEAFNDTLKNHMLHDITLNSFAQLKEKEEFIKNCYNLNKTHSGLNKMTPVEFEQHLLNLQPCQRTILKIKVLA
jgi:putative transposase